jgi:uncharacterized protein YcbK (DUF882 family)
MSAENPDRRRFLSTLSACGLAAAVGTARALPATGSGPGAGVRSVSFVHTHTGERLTAEYFAGGEYQPDCLSRVNHLLRDFRTGEVHPIDPALLDILFELRLRARHTAAFEVISGFRSAATNALLRRTTEGVAQHSMHLVGRAIDVRLEGFPTAHLHTLARSLARGGVGYYPASDFVHVDTGRVRFW